VTGNDFLMGECIQQGKIEKLNDKYEILKLQMKVRNVVRIATTPLVRPMHCTCNLTSTTAGFQDYYICEEEGHFKTNI
jgi:hypothetical protein